MCFIFYQTVFVIPAEVVVELEPVGVAAESRWSHRRRCDRPEAGSCRTSEGAWLWLIVCELKSKKQKVTICFFWLLFWGSWSTSKDLLVFRIEVERSEDQ